MLVLLLAPYPEKSAPSQRFRFEHYIYNAAKHNIKFHYRSFLDAKTWEILYSNGKLVLKSYGICKGFIKRFFLLFTIFKYDFIYIHREATPIGPPIIEWIIAKLLRKKIIYDFDDSIWVKMASNANPRSAWLKCSWKVKYICKYSKIVTVGNDFLANFARKYCKDVRIIPTVVDTEKTHNFIKNQNEQPLVIGWTGTFTNFYNLEIVLTPIRELQKKYDFIFYIIANKDPKFNDINYIYKQWEAKTEIADLTKINIGIMPLYNTAIELGKCAFKAIQYMSLGIPAVVSPVGVNCEVVGNGEDGFWADTEKEWYISLEKLITDKELCMQMGKLSREKIVAKFSVKATEDSFFNLFDQN